MNYPNRHRFQVVLAGLAIFLICFGHLTVLAIDNSDCLDCHDATNDERQTTYDEALSLSVHTGNDCVDCHQGVTDLPHDETLPAVNCGSCHDDVTEIYKYHGLLKVSDGGDLPGCAECHGKHDILKVNERDSRVNAINLSSTCGRCHENLDLTRKHEILYDKAVSVYEASVHGTAAIGGVYSAATCSDCHSPDGTAHRILDPSDPQSTVNHFNIPSTCGKCHKAIERDYWEGIHGLDVKRGSNDSPVCTDCHGEHGIIAASNPESRVSKNRVAEATCAPCHESASFNEKFDRRIEKHDTWVDSYHGLKSQSGDLSVANCASCHGVHRILPHTDPTSSIHANNLQATCGTCHPGITPEMAATPIHSTPGEVQTPLAGTLASFYVVLIVLVVGGMVIYCLIDLRKQIKSVVIKRQVIRMFPGELAQHYFLMISFIVLVITGFALRFSEAFWVQWLFGFDGGFPLRGTLHRIAAVTLCFTAAWHLVYLLGQRGRSFLVDMMPRLHDIVQVKEMLFFNLGISQERPQFYRFSFVEKAEYWALVWGTVVMVISGLSLWFENTLLQWLPKGTFDIMLVFHYYEAWLATLAIVVWHLYSTMFSPAVYPMNPSWLTGRMSEKMFRHEHPMAVPRQTIIKIVEDENGNKHPQEIEIDGEMTTDPKKEQI